MVYEIHYKYAGGRLHKVKLYDSDPDEIIYYRPAKKRLVVSTTDHGVFIAAPVTKEQITAAYKDIRKRYKENVKRFKAIF